MMSPTRTAGRLRRCLALLLLCALGGTAATAAAADSDPEAELRAVRSRIEALDRRLNEARMQRDVLSSKLRETELEIAHVVRRLRNLGDELDAKRARVRELGEEREQRRAALAREREALAGQIRASYMMGRQDYLKVLLNQEDPATLSRVLTYYAYFNRARARRIAAIEERLAALRAVEERLRSATAALERLREGQLAGREELERRRAQRRDVLARLQGEIRDRGQQLTRLHQDEQKLQDLVEGLRRELDDIPGSLDRDIAFAHLKGRLAWPARGTIRHGFGSAREGGDMRWRGVWISAAEGEDVHAVARGRIAYADWLRGFGLLVIVDHGQGYMSLYGHNQTLYKEAGDWVDAGEVIAGVGRSGGSDETGLYFEIRHNGQPQDPVSWCSRDAPPRKAALVSD